MYTAEDILNQKNQEMICISPKTTIHEAIKLMIENSIGAVVIKEKTKITGIWTERDLMRNTIEKGFNYKTSQIKDHMSTDIHYAKHNDTIYILLDKFLGLKIRHLLIKKGKKFIGIISSGDVIRANLVQKNDELKELNTLVGLKYYENWTWEKK